MEQLMQLKLLAATAEKAIAATRQQWSLRFLKYLLPSFNSASGSTFGSAVELQAIRRELMEELPSRDWLESKGQMSINYEHRRRRRNRHRR
eukprot:scaffold17160_cov31-Attheya_sp.AAC.1